MGGGTGRRSSGPDWAQVHQPSQTMGVANNGDGKSEDPHNDGFRCMEPSGGLAQDILVDTDFDFTFVFHATPVTRGNDNDGSFRSRPSSPLSIGCHLPFSDCGTGPIVRRLPQRSTPGKASLRPAAPTAGPRKPIRHWRSLMRRRRQTASHADPGIGRSSGSGLHGRQVERGRHQDVKEHTDQDCADDAVGYCALRVLRLLGHIG